MEEFFNSIKESFTDTTFEFETINIKVNSSEWIETHKKLKNEFDLKFFSWLSAIDWDNEVSIGEAPKESVSPSFEIITCLSDVSNNNLVTISTIIDKSEPKINSLVEIYAGSNWHEREAYEMFGINFENHPNLEKLYLPDGYEGNPMLKSFELISREVKPWPGEVDVEGMPEELESDKSQDG
tara:strand:+ start:254 stop:799 length:546 start_codon:yes stop_codon:yes gene_type:complete